MDNGLHEIRRRRGGREFAVMRWFTGGLAVIQRWRPGGGKNKKIILTTDGHGSTQMGNNSRKGRYLRTATSRKGFWRTKSLQSATNAGRMIPACAGTGYPG